MGHISMSHETHRCDIVVEAFSQDQPKTNNSAGVAKYHGGVEGRDAFSLGKGPCIHRPLLSVCN